MIDDKLFELSDEKYKAFNKKLIFTKYRMYGVRTPQLRNLAKEIDDFEISSNPSYEEVFLKGCIISRDKVFDREKISNYLKFVDNWALCDCFVGSLKFKKDDSFYNYCKELLKLKPNEENEYFIRFAIISLKCYYIDSKAEEFLDILTNINSDRYYINMGLAWCYCDVLIKKYDLMIKYIDKLSPFVRNKTIQKAVESYRISDDKKSYLKSLKIKS